MTPLIKSALTLASVLTLASIAQAAQNKKTFFFNRPVHQNDSIAKPAPANQKHASLVGIVQQVYFSDQITSESQFMAMSRSMDGIINGHAVKFLIDNRGPQPKISFINGQFREPNGKIPEYAEYHYPFAQKRFGVTLNGNDFNNSTYFTNDLDQKKFVAGTIQHYLIGQGPTAQEFYGIQFYPQDKIAEKTLLFAVRTILNSFTISQAKVQFVSYGAQQTFSTVTTDLEQMGVKPVKLDEVLGKVTFFAMNTGEAWGILRYKPENSDLLKPYEIPVLMELPLDLSVVSGVITAVVQDAGCHVNLKSKERGTPNMVLRDIKALDEVRAQWDGKPVHLTVKKDGYLIEESTVAEVMEKYNERANKPLTDIPIITDFTMKSFDEMAAGIPVATTIANGYRYGGKAAKLGFLAHRSAVGIGSKIQKAAGVRLSPMGFGVPLSFYQTFVAANPELKVRIDQLIAHEMKEGGLSPLEPAQKLQAIQDIQNGFYRAKVPDGLVVALRTQAQKLMAESLKQYPKSPLKKVKVRSSANVEDLENFDGAGLHSSYGAKLPGPDGNIGDPNGICQIVSESSGGVVTKEEMSPDNLICAVKGVYASLWNKRAIEERTFGGLNQHTAAMGLAVNPTYGFREKTENIKVVANAVLITRILSSGGIYGYQISLNTDDNLVTNPTPGTQSEVALATFIGNEVPEFTYLQMARPLPTDQVRTEPLLTREQMIKMVDMARQVEKSYCAAAKGYYSGSCSAVTSDPAKPKSLDMEFKIFSNGEVLVKQTREFSG